MAMRRTVGYSLLVSVLLLMTGCPAAAPSRTANQGGGNIVSAGAKIAGGKISTLTPDEIQIVTDKAIELNPDISIPELTDEQAGAAIDFFEANEIDTLDDVVELIQAVEADPGAIVVPASVEAVLENLLGG
jgi:hypothetical protein